MADTHGCPPKNLPRLHTRVYKPTVPFSTNKQKTKQLMAIVSGLNEKKKQINLFTILENK